MSTTLSLHSCLFLCVAGFDFVPLLETLTIMPRDNTTYCVTVTILDDDALELTETFDISLSPASGFESLVLLSASSDTHTVTISDDSADLGMKDCHLNHFLFKRTREVVPLRG